MGEELEVRAFKVLANKFCQSSRADTVIGFECLNYKPTGDKIFKVEGQEKSLF
jgi:hypothetical protein